MSAPGLRERFEALRRAAGSAPSAPAALAPAVTATPAVPAAPERHATRVRLDGWEAPDAGRPGVMAMLALLARDRSLAGMDPEDLLFLDLETTGLSLGAGTLAFLVGMARLQRGAQGYELCVEQHLLRAPSQERLVLEPAADAITRAGAVVTFNGKSYDMPLLSARCVLARLPPPPGRPHLDALHPSRRLLGHVLPDVKLVTLEGALWGMRREDDLASAAIPAAYFAALRGDDALMPDVLRHNADDLVTLARLPPLLAALASGEAAPTGLVADLLAVADVRLGLGKAGDALDAIAAARTVPGSPRSVRRARLARRAGGPEAARGHWSRLCREARAGIEPHEELAKILEHHDRNLGAALEVVEEALRRFGDMPAIAARLRHRQERLLRKLGALCSKGDAFAARLPRTSNEQERWRSSPSGTR